MIKRIQVIMVMCLFICVYDVYGNYENEIHYENRIGLIVEGPAKPAERISGRLTDTAYSGDARFMHRENHTIRLIEETSGVLFSSTKPILYEIRIVQPGVHIVDARMRVHVKDMTHFDVHTEINASVFDSVWLSMETNNNFITEELTKFEDGSLQFTFMPFLPDHEERLYSLDIGLLLSIEAGFEQNHGGIIEAEIFRKDVCIGNIHIANIKDLITVDASGIMLDDFSNWEFINTPLGNVIITETAPENLQHNFELRFRLILTQNGHPVNVPNINMRLKMTEPTVNEAESGLRIENITEAEDYNSVIFKVTQPSYNIPAEIVFENIFVSGPAIRGVDLHIVIYGSEISPNSYKLIPIAIDTSPIDIYQERTKIFGLGYNANVLQLKGMADLYDAFFGEQMTPRFQRRTFDTATKINIDGVYIQAVAFLSVAPHIISSMINPRVFADFIGAEVNWNDAERTAVFTGNNAHDVSQTVILKLDSPTIIVNGQPYDIAVKAGQHALEGQICPILINDRIFVPVRVLAEIFDVPIDFATGSIILG